MSTQPIKELMIIASVYKNKEEQLQKIRRSKANSKFEKIAAKSDIDAIKIIREEFETAIKNLLVIEELKKGIKRDGKLIISSEKVSIGSIIFQTLEPSSAMEGISFPKRLDHSGFSFGSLYPKKK